MSFAGTVPTNGKTVTIETADGYSVTLTHLGSIAVAYLLGGNTSAAPMTTDNLLPAWTGIASLVLIAFAIASITIGVSARSEVRDSLAAFAEIGLTGRLREVSV